MATHTAGSLVVIPIRQSIGETVSNVSIPEVLESILRPEGLRPSYGMEEAENLFRDGLDANELEVFVTLGCAGSWTVSFTKNGKFYFISGDCDACPSCDDFGEGITKPEADLRRWLQTKHVFEYTRRGERDVRLNRLKERFRD